jgi:hypothetical protein
MISDSTLLMCSMVLERYLDVLSEHPDSVTPEFRERVADAAADINKARDMTFMNIRHALMAVPTETDQASLLQVTARK